MVKQMPNDNPVNVPLEEEYGTANQNCRKTPFYESRKTADISYFRNGKADGAQFNNLKRILQVQVSF